MKKIVAPIVAATTAEHVPSNCPNKSPPIKVINKAPGIDRATIAI